MAPAKDQSRLSAAFYRVLALFFCRSSSTTWTAATCRSLRHGILLLAVPDRVGGAVGGRFVVNLSGGAD